MATTVLAQYPYTRAFQLQDGNTRPDARLVVVDAQGIIWVGGDAGLFRTDGDHTRAAAPELRIAVTALSAAGRGVLAAFANGLLVRAEGLHLDTLRSDTNWRRATVRSLCEDATGTIWIGTYGNGLYRLGPEPGKVPSYRAVVGPAGHGDPAMTRRLTEGWPWRDPLADCRRRPAEETPEAQRQPERGGRVEAPSENASW